MRTRIRKPVVVAALLAAGTVLGAADAAAFFNPGGDAILANLLANATKQLAVVTESLAELRRSYAEVRRVAEYADDAASAARSFQHLSARRLGARLEADIDAAFPDVERLRRDALGAAGVGGSPWAQGTGATQRLSSYCLADAAAGRPACAQLGAELGSSRVLGALAETFGKPGEAAGNETKVVDAEVAAVIGGDAAQARAAALKKLRVRELLRYCNGAADAGGAREAKRLAEECRLAAEQAQLLQLEEGQATNARLAEIARLQALTLEQGNAALKRELLEQEARRAALTSGLDVLTGETIAIRAGGLSF